MPAFRSKTLVSVSIAQRSFALCAAIGAAFWWAAGRSSEAAVAFTNSGGEIFVTDTAGQIDFSFGNPTPAVGSNADDIAWGPDGKLYALAARQLFFNDGFGWQGRVLFSFGSFNRSSDLAISDSGRVAFTNSGGEIFVTDTNGQIDLSFGNPTPAVGSNADDIAWGPDGKLYALAAGALFSNDGSGWQASRLSAFGSFARSSDLAISDSGRVAFTNGGGEIFVTDTNGQIDFSFGNPTPAVGGNADDIAWGPDGNLYALAGSRLWSNDGFGWQSAGLFSFGSFDRSSDLVLRPLQVSPPAVPEPTAALVWLLLLTGSVARRRVA